MRFIKNGFLVIISIVIALVIGEILLRVVFPHTPTFGTYFPRYIIDNNPSYVSGLTKSDQLLPFKTTPNYSHNLTDLAYHPKSYKITLDRQGYRNIEELEHYDNVIVGDSVAFGSGVNDDQTIAAILGKFSKVYNLSISGAGPAMYMSMIDSFLKNKTTDEITILFFLGNDLRNLSGANWKELNNCLPPKGSKITRKDVSASPESPPIILTKPILRNSFLIHFFYTYVKSSNNKPTVTNIHKLHSMIAKSAITDLRNHININDLYKSNKSVSLKMLNELIESDCADNNIKLVITEIIDDIKDDNVKNIFKKMKIVTTYFIDKNCYPIRNDMTNLVSYTNYYTGYFYAFINSVNAGYLGNIYNYISLLQNIGNIFSELKEETEQLKELLQKKENLAEIEIYSSNLQRKLNRKNKKDDLVYANNCDKINIFLDYLSSLQNRGIKVFLYLIPAEYQLKKPFKQNFIGNKAQSKGINCIDFTPRLIEHYSNRQNNALYLDGAHFTVEGNKTIAGWMLQK